MTTIIGVDPSMAATGLAVWRNERAYCDTLTTSPRAGTVIRWREILQRVWSQVDGPTVMVVETLPVGHTGVSNLLIERAGLLALLQYGASSRDIPFALVNPTTLKMYATGKGNASKADMLAAARDDRADVRNDNEADAYWCATMALDHYRYGRTLRSIPRQAEALRRVEWPIWIWQ